VTRTLAVCLASAAVACGGGDPCDGVAATCVTVRITSRAISAIDTLQLDISYAGFHATAATTAGDATALPLTAAVELAGAGEQVTVDAVAAGKLAGAVLGTGYARSEPLAPGDHGVLAIAIAARADPCVLGTYCGGNKVDGDPETLYLCHAGGADDPDGTPEADVPTARGRCANGCIRNTADDDVCSGGNLPCTAGTTYCGGHRLDGDPQRLYQCDASGAGAFVQDCEAAGLQCLPVTADSDACQ